jgi:hypothetical protein
MKLPFRHGIVQYSVDNNKVPTFLYADNSSNYVALSTSDSNVLLTFAHGDADYLYEEQNSTNFAWGPFENHTTYWLFWDLNLLTGERTFVTSTAKPGYSANIPENPLVGQYWFCLADHLITYHDTRLNADMEKPIRANCAYVWNGSFWAEKIRLLAGSFYNGEVTANSLGTQVGLETPCSAGYIEYSDYDTPSARANSAGVYRFVTSESKFVRSDLPTVSVSLQSAVQYNIAVEDIPQYKIIAYDSENRVKLANYNQTRGAGIGIMMHHVNAGESCTIVTHHHITNSAWDFAGHESAPIYLGQNGDFTLTTPNSGIIQKVGYVVNKTTVLLDVTNPAVYVMAAESAWFIPMAVDINSGKLYTNAVQDPEYRAFIHYFVFFSMYRQTHKTTVWDIKHHEKLTDVIVFCKDNFGRPLIPQSVQVQNPDTVTVTFSRKVTGTAFLFLF